MAHRASVSRARRVKLSEASIDVWLPSRANFIQSCDAMSCISSNMPRMDMGPKAGTRMRCALPQFGSSSCACVQCQKRMQSRLNESFVFATYSEQSIVNSVPDILDKQVSANFLLFPSHSWLSRVPCNVKSYLETRFQRLVKALLVANFVDELIGGDKDVGLRAQLKSEDFACMGGTSQHLGSLCVALSGHRPASGHVPYVSASRMMSFNGLEVNSPKLPISGKGAG